MIVKRTHQKIIVSMVLLFGLQAAQADPAWRPDDSLDPLSSPFSYYDIGDLARGDDIDDILRAGFTGDSQYETWFEFRLTEAASVTIDTSGSVTPDPTSPLDTILALYDYDGFLLGQTGDLSGLVPDIEDLDDLVQHNNCFTPDATSCLTISNLAMGSYIAGVSMMENELFVSGLTGWQRFMTKGGDFETELLGDVNLNISVTGPSAVPVPAAVWLFGTALIGFVGLSRRRSVKT
jgi:hypothetical protein